MSKIQWLTTQQTFSSANVFSCSNLEHKERFMYSSLVGNKIILWSDTTLVAHLLQVTDWCFALKTRNLTACTNKHAINNNLTRKHSFVTYIIPVLNHKQQYSTKSIISTVGYVWRVATMVKMTNLQSTQYSSEWLVKYEPLCWTCMVSVMQLLPSIYM